jgi:succinate-semialdehyde dehydrogenase/glutarate-semialdehyde dehydrogenase
MQATTSARSGSEPTPPPDPFLGSPRIDARVLARLAERIAVGGDRPRLALTAPATGARLADLLLGTPGDVRAAARRARAAQPAWAARAAADRTRVLLRFHDLVLARRDEALDLIQIETGKARRHAFEELEDAALSASYYGRHAPRQLRPRRRRTALPLLVGAVELRRPVGVVGVISPWNYPLTLGITDALPALAAGNAVIAKPDVQTSFTALWCAELLAQAGLPEGLFQVVAGHGPELGAPLVEAVDHLAFTGSTRTGRVVARQAAARLIGCSLELGGKNPMLVLADADLDRAAESAVTGCFSSTGQLCISFERVYVDRAVHDRFLDRFVERTRTLRLGAGLGWEIELGSLTSAAQLERVDAHVREAVERGATVHAGGRARPDLGPFFYEPTILTGVDGGMRVCAEETFGPVASVHPVADADEAVALANATPYGLNASVWTRDLRRGRALAARLAAGTVNVNDAYQAAWGSVGAPMGGLKDSGLGRRHGAGGILRYTEAQTVAVQRAPSLAPPRGAAAERWAGAMVALLRLRDRLPGIR